MNNTEFAPRAEGESETALAGERTVEMQPVLEGEALTEEQARKAEEMQKMEGLKQDLLENTYLSPNGELVEGTSYAPAALAKKEGTVLPSWLKKTAKVLGIASVGLLGSHQVQAGTETAKEGNRIETVTNHENGKEINEHVKAAWDAYVHWLDQKGLKGSPELDGSNSKGSIGIEMLEQYIKENPNTALSVEAVKDIQDYFKEYREWLIKEVQAGRATLEDGVTIEELMKRLSDKDGIPGSWTTSNVFPRDLTVHYDNAYMQMASNSNVRKN